MSRKAIDTSFLLYLLTPNPQPPRNHEISNFSERLDELKELFAKEGEIIVPTPVFAEIASRFPEGEENIKTVQEFGCFVMAPFGQQAALKLGDINRRAKKDGRLALHGTGKQEVKFDRQILSISLTIRASIFYTSDEKLGRLAEQEGMRVIYPWTLPLPSPEKMQQKLDFNEQEDTNKVVPLKPISKK